MKNRFLFLVFAIFLFSNFAFSDSQPTLLFPLQNSKLNKTTTSISIKIPDSDVSTFLNSSSILIEGSVSGIHSFKTKIIQSNQTLLLTPNVKFNTNEAVSISIKNNNSSSQINFSFETEKREIKYDPLEYFKKEYESQVKPDFKIQNRRTKNYRAGDTLPTDFPNISVTDSVAPSPGYLFLTNFSLTTDHSTNYLMILDNEGEPVYYKKLDTAAYDFKKQPNGNLTYYFSGTHKIYEMNPSYQIIDSFSCGNGYGTDLHEFRLLNNGHAFVISYDPQIVNMRNIVPYGDTVATVIGLIIQELDEHKEVIFQWRSWDHFSITDASFEDLGAHVIDYVHGNAVELDNDGNILLSCRHMDEITKINRNTGAIIWRLGGKNNQFTFLNDTLHFSHQHAVRRIANGNITLFDNGNFHPANEHKTDPDTIDSGLPNRSTIFSRAVEYKLDEVNHIANLQWQYRNVPDIYTYAMGYVQRLNNGNTIISWGTASPTVTEVDPHGNKVFELSLPNGICSYRTTRDVWSPVGVSPSPLETEIPKTFNLYQNYPNPFNPVTTIKFDIPKSSFVKIGIYNLIGQKVEEIREKEVKPGTYEYKWNAGSFASGIYFYKIETNSFTETKRMMLVK